MYQIIQRWGTFNDINAMREKFPKLLLKDSIGSFQFSYASIYGHSNTALDTRNFSKEYNNIYREISQAIFYFQKPSNNMYDKVKSKELYINLSTISCYGNAFCLSIKEYKHMIKSIHFCNISEESFEVEGDKFYLVYSEDMTKVSGILYYREINNVMYISLITTISHNWIYSEDIKTTIDFIKGINLNTFLYELYGSLDNK